MGNSISLPKTEECFSFFQVFHLNFQKTEKLRNVCQLSRLIKLSLSEHEMIWYVNKLESNDHFLLQYFQWKKQIKVWEILICEMTLIPFSSFYSCVVGRFFSDDRCSECYQCCQCCQCYWRCYQVWWRHIWWCLCCRV